MTTVTEDVEGLRQRKAPMAMSSEEFRKIGHVLVERIATGLEAVPAGPVMRDDAPAVIRRLIGADQPLPFDGGDPGRLLEDAAGLLFERSLFNGHPRFFGYITSSPAPMGMFGDFLAAALNQNVGAWRLAPVATEIEAQSVRWISELIGFPTSGGGLLVSGGNAANFVCFLAARAAKAPWDVRKQGIAREGKRMLVYASAETHTWLQKAADLFGLGLDAIRWIPVDDEQRMNVALLRQQIEQDKAEGHQPFMVVGTAGSVSTGAVDPLPEISAICREHGLWFHVDGAYGAFAALVPGAPDSLRALSEADSVAVDPHKWLYSPLEAGCALVRDAETLRRAFAYHPVYYHFDEAVLNYFDQGPQNSRGFRALKVWLSLRHVGRSGYLEAIGDDMRLARYLHRLVSNHDELEAATQSLSITTFRYVPADLRPYAGTPAVEEHLDRLNRELLSAIEKSGEAFLSNAVVNGRFMLRACIVNFHTAAGDVEALIPLVTRLGRVIDGRLREASIASR